MKDYTYFLDESGNSGDLLKSEIDNIEQPIFVLGCIGTKDEEHLNEFGQFLVKKYKIQANELKSKKILKRQDKIPLEIISFLKENNERVIIECVDKKYQILTQLVTYYILGNNSKINIEELAKKNLLHKIATLFYQKTENIPYKCMLRAVLSEEDNISDIENCFNYFLKLAKIIDLNMNLSAVSPPLIQFIKENINFSFYGLVKDNQRIFYDFVKTKGNIYAKKNFLPIPDIDKNKQYGMLPNYNCITNVIARINRTGQQNIKLIHDNQYEFENIIINAIKDMHRLSNDLTFKTDIVNYQLSSMPEITFKDSKESFGIQFADVISGLMRMTIQSITKKNESISDSLLKAFSEIYLVGRSDFGISCVIDELTRERLNDIAIKNYCLRT